MSNINRKKEQELCLNQILKHDYSGIIIASMRFGKTPVIIESIKKLNPENILWIVPDTKLRDEGLPNEFKKFNAEKYLAKTTIICDRSVSKLTGHYEYVIFDEVQNITQLNSEGLLFGDITYDHIILMTGTYPKDIKSKELIAQFKLPTIYQLTVDEASESGIIANYNIYVHYFKLDNTHYSHQSKRGLITEKQKYDNYTYVIDMNNQLKDYTKNKFLIRSRMHLLYGSVARIAKLKSLYKQLNSENKRGLVFTPYKKIAETFPNFYHSTSSKFDYEDFQNNKINSLALVNAGAVGHTYNDLDYAIIAQVNSDNKGLTSQKWARTLLPRPGYVADIHLLCAKNTIDEVWLEKALSEVDSSKIKYI